MSGRVPDQFIRGQEPVKTQCNPASGCRTLATIHNRAAQFAFTLEEGSQRVEHFIMGEKSIASCNDLLGLLKAVRTDYRAEGIVPVNPIHSWVADYFGVKFF